MISSDVQVCITSGLVVPGFADEQPHTRVHMAHSVFTMMRKMSHLSPFT